MVAKKSNQSAKSVTRIKASDSGKQKTTKPVKTVPSESALGMAKKQPKRIRTSGRKNPISAFFGYFKGAWKELRQVRWPSRGATWSLTGAVLAFSAFFIVFILLLDAFFKYIFEIILK